MKNKNIDQIVEKLSNKVWRKRGTWHHVVLFNEVTEGEFTAYSKQLGYPFKKTLAVWLANGDYLDLQDEWNVMKKDVESEYKKDPGFLKRYSDHCLKEADKLIAHCQKIKETDLRPLKNKEIITIYKGMVGALKDFMPFMMSLHIVDEILTERFAAELNRFVKEKGLTQKDFFEYQTALTLPYRKIFVLEEQENLMKIALKAKKGKLKVTDLEIEKLLKDHTDKYSWINAYIFEKLPYTIDDFTQRLNQLLTTDVEGDYTQKTEAEAKLKEQQKEYMKKISSHPELVELSKEVQVFGFLRSYRVDVPFYSFVLAMNLTEEVAKRIGIPTIDLKYLDSQEVSEVLGAGATLNYKHLIEERKKGFVSVITNDGRYELLGEDAAKVTQVVKIAEEKSDGVVKGTIAYPGKITAKCRVLFNLDDMKKVEVGDVLVIAMTDPNYIPAMVKASAFVTDQGGILCHAAIVSREMKKPCIIGTKNATKILKDGMMVEVDAEKGIVKILK